MLSDVYTFCSKKSEKDGGGWGEEYMGQRIEATGYKSSKTVFLIRPKEMVCNKLRSH